MIMAVIVIIFSTAISFVPWRIIETYMGCAGSMVVPGREMHMNIMLETLRRQTDRQSCFMKCLVVGKTGFEAWFC
jgi:hypothetical protein